MNRFIQYQPREQLKPFIKHFAVSESEEAATYRVLPDTSLVMGFQYRGRLVRIQDSEEHKLSTSGLTGLQDRFALFRNTADTGSILVYFTETGAFSFFRQPLHEFFSASLSLDHFIPASVLEQLGEQLSDQSTDQQRIAVIENFLITRLPVTAADLLVEEAIQRIRQSKGTIRMQDLAAQLHTSQSPLEKRFRKIVGATPKKFASIIRLHAVIAQASSNKSLTELAYECGYYDQAHFIKDFRLFTGQTPDQFFSGK